MSETVEYLGTIIKNCTTYKTSGSVIEVESVWREGETVIISETEGMSFYRVMKLQDRETSMVREKTEFKYYEPEWLEIKVR